MSKAEQGLGVRVAQDSFIGMALVAISQITDWVKTYPILKDEERFLPRRTKESF